MRCVQEIVDVLDTIFDKILGPFALVGEAVESMGTALLDRVTEVCTTGCASAAAACLH